MSTDSNPAFEKIAAAAKRSGSVVSREGQDIADRQLKKSLEAAYGIIQEKFQANDFSLAETYGQMFKAFVPERETHDVAMFEAATIKIANAIDREQQAADKLPYHNRAHFAKVGLNAAILAIVHNGAAGTLKLDAGDMAKLLFAAAAHDFGHDGKGNTVEGQHVAQHLESNSIDLAMAVLDGADASQKKQLSRSLELIYGTDVSGARQPSLQVRQMHDHWFGKDRPSMPARIDSPLARLARNPKDVLKAALLQDADVLHSALTPRQSRYESALVAREQGGEPTPQDGIFFFDRILHGRMTTDAARRLGDRTIQDLSAEYKRQLVIITIPARMPPARRQPAGLGL